MTEPFSMTLTITDNIIRLGEHQDAIAVDELGLIQDGNGLGLTPVVPIIRFET